MTLRKRLVTVLAVMAMVCSSIQVIHAEEATEVESNEVVEVVETIEEETVEEEVVEVTTFALASTELPDNFVKIEAITDTEVYAYTSKKLHDPTPMMTPVILVYANEAYETKEAAYEKMVEAGLVDLADNNKACVVIANPVEEKWSSKDVDVYKQILKLLPLGNDYGFGFTSYTNLMYAIGEGSGATFINEHMTQNANRIGAILTVGGEYVDVKDAMDLPAYLVNAEEKTVEYYKGINDTDSEQTIAGVKAYVDSDFTTKKVFVDEADTEVLTPEVVNAGWNNLLRRITRNVMGRCVWAEAYDMESGGSEDPIDEIFTLMDRIIPEEVGLVFNEEVKNAEVYGEGYWYEWIPEEALAADNTETFPLILNLHGSGDHPVFEAECNGWIDVAAKERLIVISPEWQINGGSSDATVLKGLVEYLCEVYPVDESRIYVTGFSAGGGATLRSASAYPEFYAAAAPLASPGGSFNIGDKEVELPMFIGLGSVDMYASKPLDGDPLNRILSVNTITGSLNNALAINNIDYAVDADNLDYDKYPFYGYDISEVSETYTSKHGFDITISSYAGEDGVEKVKLFVVDGMEHNHYTEFAPNIWEFFKQFSRNTETGELEYEVSETPDIPENPGESETPGTPSVETQTGDNAVIMPFVSVSLIALVGVAFIVYKKKRMID